jgi:hypothetical protein
MDRLPMDLDSLNEWVDDYASTISNLPRNIDTKMITRNIKVIDIYLRDAPKSDEYKKYRDLIVDILSEYKAIRNSGGGRNDCLIISFLMGVSENYRNLSYTKKYAVSNEFRRNILPRIIFSADKSELGLTSKSGTNTDEDVKKRVVKIVEELQGRGFLFDNIINLLSNLYKIFIVTLEPGKRDVQGHEQKYQPSSIIENGLIINESRPLEIGNEIPQVYNDGIIICNMNNNGHFEILTKNNIYLFGRPEILYFYSVINDNNPYKFESLIENAERERIRATAEAALAKTRRNSNNEKLNYAIALSLGPPPSRSRRSSSTNSNNEKLNYALALSLGPPPSRSRRSSSTNSNKKELNKAIALSLGPPPSRSRRSSSANTARALALSLEHPVHRNRTSSNNKILTKVLDASILSLQNNSITRNLIKGAINESLKNNKPPRRTFINVLRNFTSRKKWGNWLNRTMRRKRKTRVQPYP